MKKLFFFFILHFCLTTYPSYATDVSEQKSSIVKLFSIMGVDQQMNAGFEAMLPIVDQQASQLNLSPSAKEELKNIYISWFNHDIDREEIKRKAIQLYAETFSEEEIRELIVFYQSSVGRKFLKETPRLTKMGARIGMEEARSKQYLLQQRLQPFMDVHAK